MSNERVYESLGAWMRQRRKALDLTQAAVAACVGCARVTIRKWEAGGTRPARQTAARLASCLQIPPEQRALFVEVARGERRLDRVPPADPPHIAPPPAHVAVPVAPMPLDTVPPPAPLPPGSRMPLRRNPLFVGRAEDLRQLAGALHLGRTAAIGQVAIAAATGLGGIGKTQLACEFVHRYGQFFAGGVCWLSFADPAAIPAEVAACGDDRGMRLHAEFDHLPLDKQVQLVQAAWERPLPRLLVFDNCEDEALLAQWRPTYGGCRVLLTSRRYHWDPSLGVQPLPLDVLPRADSIALLRHFRPDLPADDADLQTIAETLGDLPLALHLASSFLAKYRHVLTPAQYRARLRAPTILDDRSLRDAGLSPTQHVQHVARTFEQSYAQLDPADLIDVLARTLLTHAACCAPGEPLPRWLLRATLQLPEDDTERALLAEDALTRLIDLGLLDTDAAGFLRIHRLVAAFVQAVLEQGSTQAVVETTMLRVVEALNAQRNPRPVLALQPHLRFIVEAALPRADARAAALCNVLGYHLWQLGVYAEAHAFHTQAVVIRRRVLGDDHPDTATSLNNLGVVLWKQGQYAAAQRYLAQALVIRRQVLRADHPDTARSLFNLGAVFLRQGQYVEAQGYYEQALAIRQQVLGPEHPDTAMSLNHVGDVFMVQGQYAAAQPYYEQALAIWRQVLGADHPHIAIGLTNVGGVLHFQGQYAAAQPYYEQALAIWRQVLGDDHPDTALSLFNVGDVFMVQGQYAEAQRSHEQALAIRQRVLGDDHPHTARSLCALGAVLQIQGQYAEAQRAYEQALAIQERVLGADHPDTALSLQSLGMLFTEQGHYAAAQDSLEQAVAICQRVLGDNHPDTARSLRALGELRHAQGETAEARHYLEQALAIVTQRLGTGHPDTAESLHQLGRVLHTQGQDVEARHYLEQALVIYEQAVGAGHPSTQRVRASLATIFEQHRER